jgi:hypothetical protein
MKKLPRLLASAAIVLSVPSFVSAQSPAQPSPGDKIEYFSLQHQAPEQMDAADAAALEKHQKKVFKAAEIYGYDPSPHSWTPEEVICPLIPDYILMRYTSKNAAGAESIFTALIPRQTGRVRIVPVLNNGATRFKPAPQDPRNFQLFSEVVPPEVAKKNSNQGGQWLTLSACYMEMTGARSEIPKNPSADVHMITVPPPTLRITVGGKEQEASFAGPLSKTAYRLWNITYNDAGRIVNVSDDQHSYGEPVVLHPSVPELKQKPVPPAPQPKPMPK